MLKYFIERQAHQSHPPSYAELEGFGLHKSLFNGQHPPENLGLEHRFFSNAVGNAPGMMFGRPRLMLQYDADAQEWHEFITPDGRFWIGWDKASRPKPKDLLRKEWLSGMPVQLHDGEEWLVPIAKLQPEISTWTGTEWTTRRDPAFDQLWELAERIQAEPWEMLNERRGAYLTASLEMEQARESAKKSGSPNEKVLEGLADKLTTAGQEMFDAWSTIDPNIVCEIMSANYHIGPAEISALGLLTHDPTGTLAPHFLIIDTFVDGAGIREARAGQKKTVAQEPA